MNRIVSRVSFPAFLAASTVFGGCAAPTEVDGETTASVSSAVVTEGPTGHYAGAITSDLIGPDGYQAMVMSKGTALYGAGPNVLALRFSGVRGCGSQLVPEIVEVDTMKPLIGDSLMDSDATGGEVRGRFDGDASAAQGTWVGKATSTFVAGRDIVERRSDAKLEIAARSGSISGTLTGDLLAEAQFYGSATAEGFVFSMRRFAVCPDGTRAASMVDGAAIQRGTSQLIMEFSGPVQCGSVSGFERVVIAADRQ